MEAWDEDVLIELFGKVRDDWINNDLTTWIGANRFYPGVSDALKFASSNDSNSIQIWSLCRSVAA
ncbi:unnamed protein product [Brassica rapa]|uniref:Uncharacterized protein n=2 Tax=Brassica TaxID=3705 RepID=A0A3P5Z1T3_BRACM|nr:unnamed protein product [Brassica napus]CAG7874066.1 unnamed protein product [Brassica rapa]VDC69844.1 unnamed protein product [Brassica rapa]